MTDKIDDGGPAFPSEGEGHGDPKYHSPGASLRDYFAAHASEEDVDAHRNYWKSDENGYQVHYTRSREAARYAYADAMLAARKASS